MDKNNYNERLRHSAAHLLAHAVYELYPETLFTLGPATENGFFQDFYLPSYQLKKDDLDKITQRMNELVKKNIPLEHFFISKAEGIALFKNNKFKLEIITTQIKEDIVGIARQDNYIDLCKGGHIERTGELEHFMLTGISTAYWRGKKENESLQRISGIVFRTKEELDEYLFNQKELITFDHRRLGQEQDLFSIKEEGLGFPFFHPNGMIIINELIAYMRYLCFINNYKEVKTPTLLSSELWKKSGHYTHYKDNMYTLTIDEKEYAIKPMNCPGMFLIYNSYPRSYKELPLRMAEFGHVHRHELSGVLSGLSRVRAFTQDDAHIFCRLNDIENEIKNIILMIQEAMATMNFNHYSIAVSTRPEKHSGSIEQWNLAINALKGALEKTNNTYTIKEGEGAFYGPKIEFCFKDSWGRSWQCGTIQLDFVQPENFNLYCINEKGEKERIVVIHQAIFGSLERFLALILEHTHGKLPGWLIPHQARVITLSENQKAYGETIVKELRSNLIRVESDYSDIPLNAKIKNAQNNKVFCMIIIGKKEAEKNVVSLRWHDETQEQNITLAELHEKMNEIKKRKK